jgi:hypothetical protein
VVVSTPAAVPDVPCGTTLSTEAIIAGMASPFPTPSNAMNGQRWPGPAATWGRSACMRSKVQAALLAQAPTVTRRGPIGVAIRVQSLPPDTAWTPRQRDALRTARRALGDARGRAAEDRGAAMSPATAVEYALLLTAPSPDQLDNPPVLGQLSARERELVALVAQGRTNAQIAVRLHISVNTDLTRGPRRGRPTRGCAGPPRSWPR